MNIRLFILLLLLSPGCLMAQVSDSMYAKEQQVTSFNWGAKVGFNSILPVINSLIVDGVSIDSKVEYKVGYMGALFFRLNIDRFFLQPTIAWHHTEAKLLFTMPDVSNLSQPTTPTMQMSDQLNLKIHSLEAPVMIGYNVVKEKQFGLSIMAGANVKYNYQIRYTTNLDNYSDEYTTDDNQFRVNLVGGIGVTLWQLFFDFTYEVGLNHRERNFKRVEDNVPLPGEIVLDKRLNMMGFSLGVLF